MRYKVYGQKSYLLSRKILNVFCNALLFALIFCWEPVFGATLGSPMWTVLTIIVVVVYASGNILLSRDDLIGMDNKRHLFWIKIGLKLAVAIIALVMLVIIGTNANRMYYNDRVSMSDHAAVSESANTVSNDNPSLTDLPTNDEPIY